MKKRLIAFSVAAAVLLSLAGCGKEQPPVEVYAEPVELTHVLYPDQFQIPDPEAYQDSDAYYEDWSRWREDINRWRENAVDADTIRNFLAGVAPEFLTGTMGNEVCSPVNVYMALAMLAEVTGEESRTQILSLLGEESVESLRETAAAIWNSCYRNDGAVTSIPASSLWLDQDLTYKQDPLDTLAQAYYAASFAGDMGTDEMNRALRSWISEQTGGLLEQQASDVELSPETVLALATTLYFRAKWSEEFNPERTTDGEFTILSPDGGTIPCKFMNSSRTDLYYWSDNFSAVGKRLENGGKMWFILPDHNEGVSVSALLDDPVTMDFILANGQWDNSKFLVVNMSVPKFDVAREQDLAPSLKRLGITNVFDQSAADFTSVTDVAGVFVSQVDHAARVAIDEEGVTAAAYTVIPAPGAAMPLDEEVDFILDKPFLFAITTETGLPLFMGVVQTPV